MSERTDWIEFFRQVCRHRPGYFAELSYETAVDHPAGDQVARPLYMVPPPLGHPIGLSDLAEEWIATDGGRL